MRNFKIVCAVLLLALDSWATCSQVNFNKSSSCTGGTTTCSITTTATGAGNAIVIIMQTNANTQTISSVSGGGTYTLCSNCAASANARSVDIAYTLASVSGATTITVTRSGSSAAWLVFDLEMSCTGTMQFDASGHANDTVAATTQSGVALTLTGLNDFIIQSGGAAVNINSISSPWTLFNVQGSSQQRNAHNYNTTSGTAPTWTLASSSQLAASAIAIGDSFTAPTGANSRLTLLGVGE